MRYSPHVAITVSFSEVLNKRSPYAWQKEVGLGPSVMSAWKQIDQSPSITGIDAIRSAASFPRLLLELMKTSESPAN